MKVFALLLVSWMVMSCGQKKRVTETELQQYLNDPKNGLMKKEEMGDVTMEVIFKPAALVSAQNSKGDSVTEEDKKNIEEHLYFIVNLSKRGNELEAYYYQQGANMDQKIQELAFEMKPNFYAFTQKGDTIPPAHYAYQRMFGATGKTSFMLVFPKNKLLQHHWLEIGMKEFGFEVGEKKFRFFTKDLEEVPTLIPSN